MSTDLKPIPPEDQYGLNERQRKFAWEYLHGEQGGNATRSYMLAYPGVSEASAASGATALLQNLKVQKFLASLREAAMKRVEGKLQPWADLAGEAQTVCRCIMRGELRSRLMLDAAREILDRALGRPAQRLEHELLQDEQWVNRALMAFAERTARDGSTDTKRTG